MDKLIECKNLAKKFGNVDVLHALDFDLSEGDTVSILGPSGSGKSTFLHICGLMEKPSSGELTFMNRKVSNLNEIEKSKFRLDSVGFLFQFHYLLPDFNILENLLIPCRLAHDDLIKSKKHGMEMIERLGLKDRLHHRPNQLSGGEQQRAALARALIRNPKIILCDEPTGNLDPDTARSVNSLLFNETKEKKVATIIVTHNQSLAAQPRMSYYLDRGKLISKKMEAPV